MTTQTTSPETAAERAARRAAMSEVARASRAAMSATAWQLHHTTERFMRDLAAMAAELVHPLIPAARTLTFAVRTCDDNTTIQLLAVSDEHGGQLWSCLTWMEGYPEIDEKVLGDLTSVLETANSTDPFAQHKVLHVSDRYDIDGSVRDLDISAPATGRPTHYTFIRDWYDCDRRPVAIVVELDHTALDPVSDAQRRALIAGQDHYPGFEDATYSTLEIRKALTDDEVADGQVIHVPLTR